ncbi:HIR complex subunit [Exophiala xenobiotica]|uniref:HIR complex subunit n=1 Tax=Vermiconidia calcicola TaxID=1690605 RepID=A0AAV9PTC8_9PEZI|nr:HIR complex subunit [Exophiala xenobiotica]KAK5528736.1 HIR complex subunit [Vermiconidia calcicola]KAK5546160.1 HIR complex subunit [Chaetothyriales sp. CCFEE 6169]KAK5292435.1 HIR complex subunit [Exophiala xenobiotica]KAK5336448.1 HIR complex subunit [Exophiala xenobiotica]
MELGDGRSSSNDLSSAPPSDAESTPGPLSHLTSHRDIHPSGNLGVRNSFVASATPAGQATKLAPQPITQVQVKPKRPRKKKDPNAPEPEKKEKAPRKPPRVIGTSRKKAKLEAPDANSTIEVSRVPNSALQSSTLNQPVSFSPAAVTTQPRPSNVTSDSRLPMHDNAMRPQVPPQTYDYTLNVAPPPPKPRSMYDPIRSLNISRPVEPLHRPPSTTPQPSQTPPRPVYNPSTSPAISGIIDHPAPSQPTTSATQVIQSSMASPYIQTNGKIATSPPVNGTSTATETAPVVLDQAPKKSAPSKKTPSEAPTRATSPKPSRAKEQPPPPGSGLLSASLFGGDSGTDATQKDAKGPNIVLHIDLKDPKNRVINFARLAEEKYGFAALYPRQAAQKERLARVAAAGAALERSASGSKFGGTSAGESGDEDLSVDIDRDSDNDGDVHMSGINGQENINSGTDAPELKKKRKKKVEEYDQDDPFVDDSELLWEAQAAASKDGFFVYCGPLVPEGEKPAVERADGTIKRGRGRGRGGGPGSRGGRAAAAASDRPSGRGGGPGSRGGGITRKPRITKAERAQMETEKLQREKIAPLVAKPAAYPS